MVFLLLVIIILIAVRFGVIAVNFFSGRLSSLHKSAVDHSDLVSILVPARNEEKNIAALLRSIDAQNYINYEVIVLDDNSTDRTFQICSDHQLTNAKVSLLRGKALPAGWLGKNFACHQLAQEARGKYLLFLDADVCLSGDVVNSAVGQIKKEGLSLLSLFPGQQTITLGEKLTVPLMYYLLLSLLPIRLIRSSPDPVFSAACGQFMLFDANCYKIQRWHEIVKTEVVEDLAIMKALKRTGLKGEALMGDGSVTCRMYNGYLEALNGFSKNILHVFNQSLPLFAVFLLLLLGGPLIIFINGNIWLTALTVFFIVTGRAMVAIRSGGDAFTAIVLHPLQLASLAIIFFKVASKRSGQRAEWKGRAIKV